MIYRASYWSCAAEKERERRRKRGTLIASSKSYRIYRLMKSRLFESFNIVIVGRLYRGSLHIYYIIGTVFIVGKRKGWWFRVKGMASQSHVLIRVIPAGCSGWTLEQVPKHRLATGHFAKASISLIRLPAFDVPLE